MAEVATAARWGFEGADRLARTVTSSPMQGTTLLNIAGVAELLQMKEDTVRTYHKRATRNRKEGKPRPGDFPAPDEVISGVPLWRPKTITTWVSNRPGRGAGGGRPWHRQGGQPSPGSGEGRPPEPPS